MIFRLLLLEMSNTALTIAGVNSFDDKPYRPPTTFGHRLQFAEAAHQSFRQRGDGVLIKWFARRTRSLVRSRIAMDFTLAGSASTNLHVSKGRYNRTFSTPTFSPFFDEVIHGFVRRFAARTISTITRSASGAPT